MDSEWISYINKKLQESPLMQANFTQNEKLYQTKLQVAKFSKVKDLNKKQQPIIYAGKDKDGKNVYYVIGMNIPDNNKPEYDQWILYFITLLEERVNDKQFIIVFFNTNLMTHSKLSDFKDFMTSWPLKYFQQFGGFYIVHANFLVKSGHYFASSDLITLAKKRTEFIDTFFALSKQPWFDFTLFEKIPEELKKYDTSFKDIIKKQQKTLIKTQQKKDVNVPISDDEDDEFDKSQKVLGQKLDAYQLNAHQFPILLDILIQYFTQNEQYLLQEGIFRKQAAVYEEHILEAAIANKKYKFIQRIEDPHIVAGVFKQFFIQLPEPIVPYSTHQLILDKSQGKLPQDQQTQIQFCRMIVESLPSRNNNILACSLGFLQKVAFFEEHNRMSVYNMAVVFAPCFFRAPNLSMQDLVNAQFFVSLTQVLITEFVTLYPGLDFKTFLTSVVDQKRQSMIPYLPDDTANMQDFFDMQPGGFQNIDQLMSTYISEKDDVQEQQNAKLDQDMLSQLVGGSQQKQPCENSTPKSSPRSSIGSKEVGQGSQDDDF